MSFNNFRQMPIAVKGVIVALLTAWLLALLSPAPATGMIIAGSPADDEQAGIKVMVDGQQVVFPDQQPYVDANQRVLVPIRFPMEAMGVLPEWLPSTQQASLTRGGTTAIFTLGSSSYTVNGVSKTMDTVPIAMNNRTLFPIRFAAEAFGATVTWDGPARSVLITTGSTAPAEDVPQPVIYKYPEDASHLDRSTLMSVTPGMDGDAVKVKCTNNDTVNVRLVWDINNNITGTTRIDEHWMSYYDLAATPYYGADGTYQLPVGTVITFDVWIKWRDSNHVSHEALVLDEYRFVVPDHPKN